MKISMPGSEKEREACYRIVNDSSNGLGSVVIEETENVGDSKFVVRGYAGGHISIERKK